MSARSLPRPATIQPGIRRLNHRRGTSTRTLRRQAATPSPLRPRWTPNKIGPYMAVPVLDHRVSPRARLQWPPSNLLTGTTPSLGYDGGVASAVTRFRPQPSVGRAPTIHHTPDLLLPHD